VGAGGLTLTGGGVVDLGDALAAPFQPCPPIYTLDRVYGPSGAALVNVDNTIAGAGFLGQGDLQLTNEAGGVIDASLPTDLILQTAGSLVNEGLLEATGAGGLYINYCVVDNVGGVIAANGGIVYGETGDVIIGGTLTSSGTGFIYLDHGSNTLDGEVSGGVTNLGYLFTSDGATLTLEGAIDNQGRIDVATSAASTSLFVGPAGAALTGGGQITLGGTGPDTEITGLGPGATLVNVDNTIAGQGQIGAGALTLVNESGGVLIADGESTLTLNTGSAAVTNAGLIEAIGKSDLVITGTVDNTGTIAATGRATITLEGADLLGGAVHTTEAATIVAEGAVVIAPGPGALLNAGVLEATGAGGTVIEGVVYNTGTLVAQGDLTLDAGVRGGGVVQIARGVATFESEFDEDVTFTGATGLLVLDRSRGYEGTVSGLSGDGSNALDLRDINFVGAGEATFTPNAGGTGGVLTVGGQRHEAQISLAGDYSGCTFVASSDGSGGTVVIATSGAPAGAAPAHGALVAAMASLAPLAHAAAGFAKPFDDRTQPLLVANPHAATP